MCSNGAEDYLVGSKSAWDPPWQARKLHGKSCDFIRIDGVACPQITADTVIEASAVGISCIRPLGRLCLMAMANTFYAFGRTLSVVNLAMGQNT